jgi:hypothetical protein
VNDACVVPSPSKASNSQALLMGYAQINASFTVDGSLVNPQNPPVLRGRSAVGAGLPGSPPEPGWPPTTPFRFHSSVVPSPSKASNSQALLMGYAQINASFTVDGSLVNQSAFDEVKRKGVVGGQPLEALEGDGTTLE